MIVGLPTLGNPRPHTSWLKRNQNRKRSCGGAPVNTTWAKPPRATQSSAPFANEGPFTHFLFQRHGWAIPIPANAE